VRTFKTCRLCSIGLLATYINPDALHIPADAGQHAAALEKILRRIPDGWGRWISHDSGWLSTPKPAF
jgi:hypothetical protein